MTLYQTGRKLMREGLVTVKITAKKSEGDNQTLKLRAFSKRYYVFLFNDLVLCCGKMAGADSKSGQGGSGGIQTAPRRQSMVKGTNKETIAQQIKEAGAKEFSFAACVMLADIVDIADGTPAEEAAAAPTHLMHVKNAFHFSTAREVPLDPLFRSSILGTQIFKPTGVDDKHCHLPREGRMVGRSN